MFADVMASRKSLVVTRGTPGAAFQPDGRVDGETFYISECDLPNSQEETDRVSLPNKLGAGEFGVRG